MTLDDIAAAVSARCTASAAFAAALPGGAWLARGPDQPTGAYAVFTLERDGDPEWFSDSTYLQGYALRMAAYTAAGTRADYTPAQAGDTPAAQLAQLAMAAALNAAPTAWDPLRDGSVNVCLPRGYDGRHADQLREGKDVFVGAAQWHLLVEGSL